MQGHRFINLLGLGGASGSFPGAAIDLNFAASKYFGVSGLPTSFLTTTRASQAYANDGSGNWNLFANNVPRVTNLGLLVEEARTNQVTNSAAQTIGNGWVLENQTAPALQAGQGPGAGLDAYLYDDGTTPAVPHRLSPAANMAFVSGTSYAMSVFVKYVNAQFAQIIFPSGAFGATAYANFDILNNVLGTVGAGTTATITPYPNGWKRIEIVAAATASVGSLNVNIQNIATGTDARAQANNGNHNQFLIWNMQVETGASITSPIVTAGSPVTRAADAIKLTSPPAFGAACSMFAQFTPQAPVAFTTAQFAIQADDGTNTNRLFLRRESPTAAPTWRGIGGTGFNISNAGIPLAVNSRAKIAGAAAAGDQAGYSGGAVIATSSVAALPATETVVRLGSEATGTAQLNGFLERIALWPTTRISNAQLQAFTT